MATVTVRDLQCEVTYTIIAGGIDGGTGELVGPRSSHGTITADPCPVAVLPTTILAHPSITGTTYIHNYSKYIILIY